MESDERVVTQAVVRLSDGDVVGRESAAVLVTWLVRGVPGPVTSGGGSMEPAGINLLSPGLTLGFTCSKRLTDLCLCPSFWLLPRLLILLLFCPSRLGEQQGPVLGLLVFSALAPW